jgi:hypothetical protein
VQHRSHPATAPSVRDRVHLPLQNDYIYIRGPYEMAARNGRRGLSSRRHLTALASVLTVGSSPRSHVDNPADNGPVDLI